MHTLWALTLRPVLLGTSHLGSDSRIPSFLLWAPTLPEMQTESRVRLYVAVTA